MPQNLGQLRERGMHGQQWLRQEDQERRRAEGPVQRQGAARLMSNQDSPLRTAYERLMDLHLKVLLQHGGAVAGGVALAITEVAALLPDDEKQPVLVQWPEDSPANQ